MREYLIDEGILLTEDAEEFDIYASVYDKKYGYYDELQYYVRNESDAIKDARDYVEAGVENTYAIVSISELGDITQEEYSLDDVIYSVAKINGEIVENFLG